MNRWCNFDPRRGARAVGGKRSTSIRTGRTHNEQRPKAQRQRASRRATNNFSLELLPLQLDFVAKRCNTRRQTPANTHRILPTSDEELIRRYFNTSLAGRLQFCNDPNNAALLPNYVQMALQFIDHEEHQPTREWLDSLLTPHQSQPQCPIFLLEHTTLNTPHTAKLTSNIR
eukprot:scaffold1299_cov117-Skeletonema_dohrnii-CCMP3373.AAC.2